jgi:hypothetical protein
MMKVFTSAKDTSTIIKTPEGSNLDNPEIPVTIKDEEPEGGLDDIEIQVANKEGNSTVDNVKPKRNLWTVGGVVSVMLILLLYVSLGLAIRST